MSDIYHRVERAYHLAVELDLALSHLIEALTAILAGRIADAHHELWMGDWTREVPAECAVDLGGNVYELPETKRKRKRRAA
jgi:hypothetical protein